MKHDVKQLLTLATFGKIGPRGFAKMRALSVIPAEQSERVESVVAEIPRPARRDWDDILDISRLTTRDLIKVGINPEIAQEFVQFRDQFDVEAELEKLERYSVRLVPYFDSEYPPLLKEIHDAPYLLFVIGSLQSLHRSCLAVVGSRKHTHYGRQIIEQIVTPLAAVGITIVSGLALGIDGLAHKAALDANGVTVAILGCGLDRIYPTEHESLAEKIVSDGGAIISEYPLGTAPLKQHFPARNRIIAGMCQGTLVVECDVQSGAMITAHHALEENRDVYAVPGPITSNASAGPNALLRMGAHVITCAEDLQSYYGLEQATKKHKGSTKVFSGTLPPQERLVFDVLTHEPQHIDVLSAALEISMPELNSALLFLEMKGLVHNVGAANYIKR